MDTCFATAERASEDTLAAEIGFVSKNPVVSGLLHTVGGLLAVLDEHLQIVALNDSLLSLLCIEHPDEALGLRLGEVMRCVHAHGEPAGCCTTKACATCGAALSIVTSLGLDKPVERVCALRAVRGGQTVDIALLVRSTTIRFGKRRFLLVFIQDITQQQKWAQLERMFIRDVGALSERLLSEAGRLVQECSSENAAAVHETATRLSKELALQRYLSGSEPAGFQPSRCPVDAGKALKELQALVADAPAAKDKTIRIDTTYANLQVATDFSLLMGVLRNMLLNALEATGRGGTVKVWLERQTEGLSFCVWNLEAIPESVAPRVFQRNFSTKPESGGGFGTYAMKLFGESFLGGRVAFTSAPETGTVFRLTLPR